MSANPELGLRPIATLRSGPVQDRATSGSPPSTAEDGDSNSGSGSGTGSGECRTPTARESKLPSVARICPPAPRKPRRVVLCKRRLLVDIELVSVGKEELESLFRMSCAGDSVRRPDAKKRKFSCHPLDGDEF